MVEDRQDNEILLALKRVESQLFSKLNITVNDLSFLNDLARCLGFVETVFTLDLFRKAALCEALLPVVLDDLSIIVNYLPDSVADRGVREGALQRLLAYRETYGQVFDAT